MDIPLLTFPLCWGGEFSVLIYKTPTCFGLHRPIFREGGCTKRGLGRIPSFLSALQPWVSLGFLNNQSPFLSVFHLLHPLLYLHYFQVCYHIIHPSQTRSPFSSSYKQSSFHHLSWHRSHFDSLYMSQPSYSLSFCKFHNVLPVYESIQFIISNSPDIPLLDRPIDLPQYFPFENP